MVVFFNDLFSKTDNLEVFSELSKLLRLTSCEEIKGNTTHNKATKKRQENIDYYPHQIENNNCLALQENAKGKLDHSQLQSDILVNACNAKLLSGDIDQNHFHKLANASYTHIRSV